MTPLTQLQLRAAEIKSRLKITDDLHIEKGGDSMDQISAFERRVTAESLLDADTRQLKEVLAAIERCKDGTYGECSVCESQIPAKRLAAIPSAILCIGCAEISEREAA